MNGSGYAIIGGSTGTSSTIVTQYGALVSPSGEITSLTGTSFPYEGSLSAAAINDSRAGIIGGSKTQGVDPYAALVAPNGTTTEFPLTGFPVLANPGGQAISGASINSSGYSVIGGYAFESLTFQIYPYAALVSPDGVITALTGPETPSGNGFVGTVSINDMGHAIIGGVKNTQEQYAALVSPDGSTTALTGPALPSGDGFISGVAINPSGTSIIGGQSGGFGSEEFYAALVTPGGVTRSLTGDFPHAEEGSVYTVAINPSGASIIGGAYGTFGSYSPFGALVSPDGNTMLLRGSDFPAGSGSIGSVAINSSGVGLIGGDSNDSPFAAIVAPNGAITALTGSIFQMGEGRISSVAMGEESILSLVDPKSFGPGNTFADALFALSTSVLESHLTKFPNPNTSQMDTAALSADAKGTIRKTSSSERTAQYALWAAPFGLYARHKSGDNFPALRDRGIGGILGFDYLGWQDVVLGGGGAYAYQDINYSDNYGKARVHQEFLTLYGAWYQRRVTIQGALWGGLYQMKNIRKTLGTLSSTSHINGGLFSPHLEIRTPLPIQNKGLSIEPFVMFDWVNNWQGSVKETGKSGLNLRINSRYVSLLRSEIGFHFLESIRCQKGDLSFEQSLSYVNKVPFNTHKTSTYYVGSISTFSLQMFSGRIENLGALRLSGRFTPNSLKSPYIALSYLGELGSKFYSNTLSLEIGQRF
jgi:hypothetical protein